MAGDPQFDVRLAESPAEMEAYYATRCDRRLLGTDDCWVLLALERRRGRNASADVKIDDWARPWNSKSDRRIGDAPPSALWATDDGGFGQVGCVYTAQGFEYDWNGVIIGPDLVWRDGRFVPSGANQDPISEIRRHYLTSRFDLLVRNVYKVLLTRGMVGTVIYSADRETREALRSLFASRRGPGPRAVDLVHDAGIVVDDDHASVRQ